MRLRRETGDFNLVFDWTKEQYECQIRKGLNAEDLVGAIVTLITKDSDSLPPTTAVVPVIRVEKNDNFETITCRVCAGGDGSLQAVVYDPETGIVSCRPRV